MKISLQMQIKRTNEREKQAKIHLHRGRRWIFGEIEQVDG